jgi:sodium/hydrogen antiporter
VVVVVPGSSVAKRRRLWSATRRRRLRRVRVRQASPHGWLLVPLLLLALRPVTTLAAFARSSVPVRERAFIGWFGIRGIGSLYYVAAIIDERVLTEAEAKTVFWTVIALAGVSILAHGLTATSLTRRVAAPGAMES